MVESDDDDDKAVFGAKQKADSPNSKRERNDKATLLVIILDNLAGYSEAVIKCVMDDVSNSVPRGRRSSGDDVCNGDDAVSFKK